MIRQPESNGQRRAIVNRAHIRSIYGDLGLEQQEVTEISVDATDVQTTTTSQSLELDGEIIHDVHRQIVGRCQIPGCHRFLTARTLRMCATPTCRLILCLEHARFHRGEGLWFCHRCYHIVLVKRFFLTLAWLLFRPFVRKVQ